MNNLFRGCLGWRLTPASLTAAKAATATLFVALAAIGPAQVFTTWSGNGHRYAVVELQPGGTWDDANAGALALGGYLATLTSEAENEFVFSLTDDPAYWVPQGNVGWNFGPWFGLVQRPGAAEPGGGWEWVTGETFSYSNWNPQSGEPNDSPHNEDRAHFHAMGSQRLSYWNDLQGSWPDRPNSYVVELDAVPEPLSAAVFCVGAVSLAARRREFLRRRR